jgi:hypothetical protein
MTEDDFMRTIHHILDDHSRPARLLTAALWVIVTLLVVTGSYSAYAQTAVPVYPDSRLAWDYPEGVEHHAGFRIEVDGQTSDIPAELREIEVADTPLTGVSYGQYLISLIAVAVPPGLDSEPATLLVDWQSRPQLPMPTRTRTIWEWEWSSPE